MTTLGEQALTALGRMWIMRGAVRRIRSPETVPG